MQAIDWDELKVLFLRYRAGDEQAADRVFRAVSARLSRYFALRMAGAQNAQDLTQATLLKMHFARDRFDAERSLKTWVFTIASRLLIDAWRGGRPGELDGGEPTEVDDLAAEHLADSVRLEYNDSLQKALTALKPIDQTIVYLYAVEQLSMAEVAIAVGLTEGTAKVRAHRSYVKLRALLADETE